MTFQHEPQAYSARPPAKKRGGLVVVAVVAFVLVALSAGGYALYVDDQTERGAAIARKCVQSTRTLDSGQLVSVETFEKELEDALESCSTSCDRGDAPSCRELDAHMAKVCSADAAICKRFCKTVTSPSGRKAACAHQDEKTESKE